MDNLKGLLAKCWKNETLDLDTGHHEFDDTITIRVTGSIEKMDDQYVAPTTSLPTILTLALFWQKCGVTRDHALNMLKEAVTEAMTNGKDKDTEIAARVKDVEKAVEAIKRDLIAKLPKQKRAGRVVTKNLNIEVEPVHEESFAVAVA
ncbi:MAG: hypothetical protein IH899_03380 [Planctomycetes bacterium]|nr:hypothetical protein [Planctomycetota bacterium]